MRGAAVVLVGAALHPGCESCDFSFGRIPVEVVVTPPGRAAQVEVCADAGAHGGPGPTCAVATAGSQGPYGGTTPGDADEDRAIFDVPWDQALFACRIPALVVDVTAEGCAPVHLEFERAPGAAREPVIVDVALECG